MLVRSVLDLPLEDVEWVLHRADAHKHRAVEPLVRDKIVSLAFFEPSLRTRVGFAAAAHRLGCRPVEVHEVRASAVAMPESVHDTVRTLAGYSDLVVVRVDHPLVLDGEVPAPVLNGGDRGPQGEHPSQALIDLYALRQLAAPLDDLVVAICGDLRMRAARSLLILLSRLRPRRVVLISEPALLADVTVPAALAPIVEHRSLADLSGVDALYVVGIPHGALDEPGRARLRVTTEVLDSLDPGAVVLCPMPVIDEIERTALSHLSVRVFEQSDDGLFVRMALLDLILGHAPDRYGACTPTVSR